MAFVPPQDDKIKKMGKKEKIPAYIYADPDDPNIIYYYQLFELLH